MKRSQRAMSRRQRRGNVWQQLAVVVTIAACVLLLALAWMIGDTLTKPALTTIGAIPKDFPAQAVQFPSASGSLLKGWLVKGQPHKGAVVLMHGIRGNRRSMLSRARFLAQAGYSVLLFDFQASGESQGQRITIGYLESKDARAAVEFVQQQVPREKIGVIGVSMGGAAALLATPPLPVEAMVLELVYASVSEAIANRLAIPLGSWGRLFTPLLTVQFRLKIGIDAKALRPIDRIGDSSAAVFLIAGGRDRRTPLAESQRLFNAAQHPKELWVIDQLGHEDAYAQLKTDYEQRVLTFLARFCQS